MKLRNRLLIAATGCFIFGCAVMLHLFTRLDGMLQGRSSPSGAIAGISNDLAKYSRFTPVVVNRSYFAGVQDDEPDGTDKSYIGVRYDARFGIVTETQGHSQLRRIYGISRDDIHQVARQKGDLDDLAKLGW